MTNPSYTDEQVLEAASRMEKLADPVRHLGDETGWMTDDVAKMLRQLHVKCRRLQAELKKSQYECGNLEQKLETLGCGMFALQAEVEALRPDRDRLDYIALKGVAIRKAGNGRSNLFVWYQNFPIDGDGPLLNLRTAIDRATPNETKGAKS